MIAFCHDQLDDRGCPRRHEEARSRDPGSGSAQAIWVHDAQIAAAVIASPAAGYAVVGNDGKRPAVR